MGHSIARTFKEWNDLDNTTRMFRTNQNFRVQAWFRRGRAPSYEPGLWMYDQPRIIPLAELWPNKRDTTSLRDHIYLNSDKFVEAPPLVYSKVCFGRALSISTKDSGYETDDQGLALPFRPKDKEFDGSHSCYENGHNFQWSLEHGDHCVRCGVGLGDDVDDLDFNISAGAGYVEQSSFNESTLEPYIEPRGLISDETRGSDAPLRNCDTVPQDDLDEVTSIPSQVSIGAQCSTSLSERSIDSDGVESGNDDEQPVLVIARHHLLQRLMQEFYIMLSFFLTETPQDSPGQSTESIQTPPQTKEGKSNQKSASKNGKRRLERNDENGPEDDQSGDRKKRGSHSGAVDGDDSLLACPFYKYDPRKYTCTSSTRTKYRTCAGPGFDSIARLKQHLKRNHSAPIQCLRCWQTFSDQTALATHSRSELLCQVLPLEVVEGISQQKFDRMKKWGSTWNEIFAIIFPGAPLPESCYHDFELPKEPEGPPSPSSQDLADYEAYARIELPRLVEATLEALIQAETEPLEEKLKPLLVDVVRSCQSTLGHRWSMIKSTPQVPPQEQLLFDLSEQNDPQVSSIETDPIHDTWGPLPDVIVAPAIVEAAYQEPRLLGLEESSTAAEAFKKSQGLSKPTIAHQRVSDSGYSSLLSEDFCRCDQFFDFSYPDTTTEQAHIPATEPGTAPGPFFSSALGLRQAHFPAKEPCTPLSPFFSSVLGLRQAHFPAKEPGTALGPFFSSVFGLRQGYSTSMADLRSEDEGRNRCEFCGGLLIVPSSATERRGDYHAELNAGGSSN